MSTLTLVADFIFFGFVGAIATYLLIIYSKRQKKRKEKPTEQVVEGMLGSLGLPTDSSRSHAMNLVKKIADSGGWRWFELSRNRRVVQAEYFTTTVHLDFRTKNCACIILKIPKGYDIGEVTRRMYQASQCLVVSKSKILELAPNFYDGCDQEEQGQYLILINLVLLGKTVTREKAVQLREQGKITSEQLFSFFLASYDDSLGYRCMTVVETEAEEEVLKSLYAKDREKLTPA